MLTQLATERNAGHFAQALGLEGAIVTTVKPGLWEHWKSSEEGCKLYVVESVGIEQDTFRPQVAYTALYGEHVGQMTFRHLTDEGFGFLTPINRPDARYVGPRFIFVRALTPIQRTILRVEAHRIALATHREEALQTIGLILECF